MPWYELLAIFAAGVAAGTINTIVGSGSLITFPTLLAFGIPPVTANVSNNIGMVPGGVSGTWGYRRELRGQGALVRRLVPMSLLGSVAGALLLLWLPAAAFQAIVPVLLAISLVMGGGLTAMLLIRSDRNIGSYRERKGAAAGAVGAPAPAPTGARRPTKCAAIFMAGDSDIAPGAAHSSVDAASTAGASAHDGAAPGGGGSGNRHR